MTINGTVGSTPYVLGPPMVFATRNVITAQEQYQPGLTYGFTDNSLRTGDSVLVHGIKFRIHAQMNTVLKLQCRFVWFKWKKTVPSATHITEFSAFNTFQGIPDPSTIKVLWDSGTVFLENQVLGTGTLQPVKDSARDIFGKFWFKRPKKWRYDNISAGSWNLADHYQLAMVSDNATASYCSFDVYSTVWASDNPGSSS